MDRNTGVCRKNEIVILRNRENRNEDEQAVENRQNQAKAYSERRFYGSDRKKDHKDRP